jgi:hypothetical protein
MNLRLPLAPEVNSPTLTPDFSSPCIGINMFSELRVVRKHTHILLCLAQHMSHRLRAKNAESVQDQLTPFHTSIYNHVSLWITTSCFLFISNHSKKVLICENACEK